MAKTPKDDEIELEPDAWQRFERFVRGVAKAGPQHRTSKHKGRTAQDARRKKSREAPGEDR